MTESPRAVAQEALRLAQETLPPYSAVRSRKDFTQHQLVAILALKTFLKTDYRGVVAFLADCAELRDDLGLTKLPHYSTLKYAQDRLLKGGLPRPARRRRHVRTRLRPDPREAHPHRRGRRPRQPARLALLRRPRRR
jgi:hypothetical protein